MSHDDVSTRRTTDARGAVVGHEHVTLGVRSLRCSICCGKPSAHQTATDHGGVSNFLSCSRIILEPSGSIHDRRRCMHLRTCSDTGLAMTTTMNASFVFPKGAVRQCLLNSHAEYVPATLPRSPRPLTAQATSLSRAHIFFKRQCMHEPRPLKSCRGGHTPLTTSAQCVGECRSTLVVYHSHNNAQWCACGE